MTIVCGGHGLGEIGRISFNHDRARYRRAIQDDNINHMSVDDLDMDRDKELKNDTAFRDFRI